MLPHRSIAAKCRSHQHTLEPLVTGERAGSIKARILSVMLLAGTSCLAFSPVAAAGSGDRRAAMADAMLNMMGAMGFGGADQADTRGSNLDPANGGAPWGAFMGAMPGSGAVSPDMMERWSRRPWSPPNLGAPSSLDGVWLSDSGERLTIRGERFRLEAGPGRASEGVLRLRGTLLALYQPGINRTWTYEYAVHEGRLALRDAQGQLFLYRRIPWEGR